MAIFTVSFLLFRSRRLRAEAAAVVAGAHADASPEGPPHGLDGAEADLAGDRLGGHRPALEGDSGALDPRHLDVGGGRHPRLPSEGAGEVALAHARAFRQRRDREVAVEVVGNPLLQLAQRLALGALGGELRAELRLSAGPLEEEDEPARDLERGRPPEVLLDQR